MSHRKKSLRSMMGAGFSALVRYPGLALSVYAVQLVASALAGITVMLLIQGALGAHPILDRAAAGDLVALAAIVAEHPMLAISAGAIIAAATAAYGLLSWFLHGGVIAVYVQTPRTRREVAQTFGAGGATTYFAYARLFALSLVAYVAVGIVLAISAAAAPSIANALTTGEAITSLTIAIAPAAFCLAAVRLIIDYARIDITRRRVGALRAAARATITVLSSWRPATFALLYYLAFAAISALAWWLLPASAAATATFAALIAGRQLTALARFAAKLVLIAGEIDYAQRTLHTDVSTAAG